MNKIINKLLLVGEKCIPNMQLKQPGFMYSAYEPFIKNKERIQKFKKAGVHDIFIKTNYINLAFKMTWLMEISRNYLKEQLLVKYYVI